QTKPDCLRTPSATIGPCKGADRASLTSTAGCAGEPIRRPQSAINWAIRRLGRRSSAQGQPFEELRGPIRSRVTREVSGESFGVLAECWFREHALNCITHAPRRAFRYRKAQTSAVFLNAPTIFT